MRKQFALAALIGLVSMGGIGVASGQDWKADTSFASPGHSLKSARESLEAKYYPGAVAELSTLVSRVPADPEVYFLLGAAHWGNGNKEEAHKALEKALSLDARLASRLGEYPLGPGNAGRITIGERPNVTGEAGGVATRATTAPPQMSVQEPPASATSAAIGSAAYFLKYARHQLDSGDGPGAANYARQALRVEPNNAEAKLLLSKAMLAGPAKAKTCQQQWSSCWVTAKDFSDKNMCTQRRLACEAGKR